MNLPAAGSQPPDLAALRPGERVEEYEIQQVLGGGGFGITYLARDTHLDLSVALKEFFPGDLVARGGQGRVHPRTREPEPGRAFALGLQRFVDEARALATFRHPNIVRVLRYFHANGTAYIVMEYESGESLRRWLPRHLPMNRELLLSAALPLLDGLAAVHGAGFLHRDIKPDNIYMRADGSPVLLDFGAARRVLADGEMTNIVSPGFAPFEQYHSQGRQGPWTDIYALGAVMYWMATGRKPLEAAARIQSDAMPAASSLVDASAFGSSLLQAIDWALEPAEARRPQSVQEFRDAIQGENTRKLPHDPSASPPRAPRPEPPPAATGPLPILRTPQAARTAIPADPPADAPAGRRTLLGTILFMDLVGYSQRSVDDQATDRQRLADLIARALEGVPEPNRLLIDTGDGAAVCFMGDPEEALESALLLRDLAEQRHGSALPLRMGLHIGPVRVVSDLNRRVNVIGDGINVAQRVMHFAQPNQVLVSRAYHDVISRITDDRTRLFRYMGPYQDKHGRVHELHLVRSGASRPAWHVAQDEARTRPLPREDAMDPQAIEALEFDLARRIGPVARLLVDKARRSAHSLTGLRDVLAPLMDETGSRASTPVTGKTASQPTGWPLEALHALEQLLARQLGPMARIVVQRHGARTHNQEELLAALADQVHPAAARERFLQQAREALSRLWPRGAGPRG